MTRKRQILLAFILPALVALVTIAVFLEQSQRRLAVERWSLDQRALVSALGQQLEDEIRAARDLIAFTGQLPEFRHLGAVDRASPAKSDPAVLRQSLERLIQQSDRIASTFVLRPNGDLSLTHPPAAGSRLAIDPDFLQQVGNSDRPVVSDGLIDAGGAPGVIIAVPLRAASGEIHAYLGAVVHLRRLSARLHPANIAPFDYGLLSDRRQRLIAHSDPVLTGEGKQLATAKHPLLVNTAVNAEKTRFLDWQDPDGVTWLSFAYQLESGWQLLLFRNQAAVTAEFAAPVRNVVLLVAAILMITGGIGIALAQFNARRWEQADEALTLARDNLEDRVRTRTAELAESEQQLQRSRDFYLSVLENFPALIWRSDVDGKIDYLNRTWLEFTGRPFDEEQGEGWLDGVHLDDLDICTQTYQTRFLERRPFSMEFRLRRHDDEYRWLFNVGRPFHDIDGHFIGFLGTCFDITELREASDQLGLVASVFSHAREGIIITDPEKRILDVNQAFCDITGYSHQEAIGKTPALLRSGQQSPEFYQSMWQEIQTNHYWQGELWNRRKDGEPYAELLTISAVLSPNGELRHYVGIFADITAQKEHEQRLEKLAHFDPLTELPNRTLLADRLHMSLAMASRNKQLLAVCLLDLDGFKQVNDRLGHAAGDQLLIDFAQRMRHLLRQTDTLARLGGDEFVILLNDLNSVDECIDIILRLIAEASRPYPIDGHMANVSASIGITIYPDDGGEADLLLRHADQAMYIAKQGGGNRYFMFDPGKDLARRAEHSALDRMQQALDQGEFELYYQPKVDMVQGKVLAPKR
jgi:diguanylate cyclase (GGDEF)-like protein/PAS domain S-box-containing protein